MTKVSDKKASENHKFPHLQKEVDSLLENFDDISYGIDSQLMGEQEEFNHINIDDVMAGRTEQKVSRPKVSVVEKARLQEKRSQDLHDRTVRRNSLLQNDVLLARRETQSSLEEVRLISFSPKNETKKSIKNGRIVRFTKLILKYLKF